MDELKLIFDQLIKLTLNKELFYLLLLTVGFFYCNSIVATYKGRDPYSLSLYDRFFGSLKYLLEEVSGNPVQKINVLFAIAVFFCVIGFLFCFFYMLCFKSMFDSKILVFVFIFLFILFVTIPVCEKFTRARYKLTPKN